MPPFDARQEATHLEQASQTNSHDAFKELRDLTPQQMKAVLAIMKDDMRQDNGSMTVDSTNQQLIITDPFINARGTYGS